MYIKLMDHLYENYIKDFCCYFVKCYMNKMLNFNLIVIFCSKCACAILKKQLRILIESLK